MPAASGSLTLKADTIGLRRDLFATSAGTAGGKLIRMKSVKELTRRDRAKSQTAEAGEVQMTFTAKWVYKDYVSGAQCERLIDASGGVHVAYDNRTPDSKLNEAQLMLGIYTVPINGGVIVIGENVSDGSSSMALAFGTVYIMNDAGKTVAKYYLSETPDWVGVKAAPNEGSAESGGTPPIMVTGDRLPRA